MSFTTFTTKTDAGVMTVTLNNGETNLMSAIMTGELFALVGQLGVNPEIKVVVFESANSDFFISHFDLTDVLKSLAGDPSIPSSKFPEINILQSLNLSIQALPQVTIAKINGVCRGAGFEFMLSMDMVFASEQARFCLPEASLGFLPGAGGATLLGLRVGKNRAMEIMLTGRDFSGSEAEQYGFVNRTVENTQALNAYVQDAATRIAANNTAANQAVKATLKKTVEGFTDAVMAGFAQENESMIACLSDPTVIKSLQLLAANSGTYQTEIDLPKTISELQ